MSTLDILPTLVDLMGIEVRNEQLTGTSLLPRLRGETSDASGSERVLIHQHAHNHAVAVRRGPWKLILGIANDSSILDRPPQLYDLDNDPLERHNRAGDHPERVAELSVFAEPWLRVGTVEKGIPVEVSPEDIAHLKELGYIEP